MSRAVPVAKRKIAIDLIRSGSTYLEAARATGFSDHAVRMWCYAVGVKSVPRPRPRNPNHVRAELRAPIVAHLDSGHTVAETAARFGYQYAAIKEVEAMVARQRAKLAARRAKTDARMFPSQEIVNAIRAMWSEGFEVIAPSFVRRKHNMREIEVAFDQVDRSAILRIIRGAQ